MNAATDRIQSAKVSTVTLFSFTCILLRFVPSLNVRKIPPPQKKDSVSLFLLWSNEVWNYFKEDLFTVINQVIFKDVSLERRRLLHPRRQTIDFSFAFFIVCPIILHADCRSFFGGIFFFFYNQQKWPLKFPLNYGRAVQELRQPRVVIQWALVVCVTCSIRHSSERPRALHPHYFNVASRYMASIHACCM